jgi:hypothetical protein
LRYVNHPKDVAASGWMWAAGDCVLEIFIGCMLLVLTFVLVLVIRTPEHLHTGYSRILLVLSRRHRFAGECSVSRP